MRTAVRGWSPLEHDTEFPYAVVRSGVHYVRVR